LTVIDTAAPEGTVGIGDTQIWPTVQFSRTGESTQRGLRGAGPSKLNSM